MGRETFSQPTPRTNRPVEAFHLFHQQSLKWDLDWVQLKRDPPAAAAARVCVCWKLPPHTSGKMANLNENSFTVFRWNKPGISPRWDFSTSSFGWEKFVFFSLARFLLCRVRCFFGGLTSDSVARAEDDELNFVFFLFPSGCEFCPRVCVSGERNRQMVESPIVEKFHRQPVELEIKQRI